MDPVNQGARTSSSGGQTVEQSTQVETVSPGYDTQDSASLESGASTADSTAISPDQPTTLSANSRDVLQQAFDARLDSFRAVVSDFNRRFDAGSVDLNDSRSLLLMLKGMLSDTQALLGAASIDQSYSNRSISQRQRVDSASEAVALKQAIRNRDGERNAAVETVREKVAEMASKQALKQQKEAELLASQVDNQSSDAVADSGSIPETDGDVLRAEIAQLGQELQLVQSEIEQLDARIDQFDLHDQIDLLALQKTSRQLSQARETFDQVGALIGRIKLRLDDVALDTGEERRQQQKEQLRRGDRSRNTVEQVRDRRSELVEVSDNQLQSDSNFSGGALERLREVFATDSEVLRTWIAQHGDQTVPAAPSAEEGLAIVFGTRIEEEGPERVESVDEEERTPVSLVNPADEPYLGDNLSLEGASSPQVFSRLWMEDRRAEGEESREESEQRLDEEQVLVGADDVLQSLREFESVPLEAADALGEQQKMAEQIGRNKRF